MKDIKVFLSSMGIRCELMRNPYSHSRIANDFSWRQNPTIYDLLFFTGTKNQNSLTGVGRWLILFFRMKRVVDLLVCLGSLSYLAYLALI